MMSRLPFVVTLLCLSACGTTVPLGAQDTQLGGQGLTAPSTVTASAGSALSSTSGPDGGAAGQLAPGTGPATGPAGAGTASGQPGPATFAQGSGKLTASYRGVTATTVYVGLATSSTTGSSGAQIASAYGISGFTSGPDRPIQDAMVSYINHHGGINGRHLVAVYSTYSGTDPSSYAQQSEATCATFTQDNAVFGHIAVVSDATFYSCMEKAGTVGVEPTEIGSQQASEAYPGIFSTSDLNYTTAGSVTVQALVRSGFLTSKNKIGLLQEDTPDFDLARSQGMNAALKTAGLKFFDIERISRINSTSDEGTVVQQANSAVLRFHSEGVDRILFLTTYGGLLDAIFMKDASQQHYYPEYGLSSHDAPVALGGGNVPADQLANAQGLGWAPFTDFATVPADQTAPSEPKCLHILESAGVPAPTDRGQVNQDLLYCSSFLLFAKIATAAGPDLTRRSFIRAGEALGDAYDDPLAIRGASEIGPGSHQGITDGELIRYVPSCTCFEPAGPVVRIR